MSDTTQGPPSDVRRMWADHYARVRERIEKAAQAARPPATRPATVVRAVVDRTPAVRLPICAAGDPAPPKRAPAAPQAPRMTPEERAALQLLAPTLKPRRTTARRQRQAALANERRARENLTAADMEARMLDILTAHDVTWGEVIGHSHAHSYIRPRLEIYRRLMREGWSYSAVGRACKRNHATIVHYIKQWGLKDA